MMYYTQEEREKRIRTRLGDNIDTLTSLLASGAKITIIPSRSAIKIFVGREQRLDLDNKRVGGGADGKA